MRECARYVCCISVTDSIPVICQFEVMGKCDFTYDPGALGEWTEAMAANLHVNMDHTNNSSEPYLMIIILLIILLRRRVVVLEY